MESSSYFTEFIQNIEILMKNKQYKKVRYLIQEELNHAYTPYHIEEKLKMYFVECNQFLDDTSNIKTSVPLDWKTEFNKGIENKLAMLEFLKEQNIRNYMDDILEVLNAESNPMIQSFIIVLLCEQQISVPITVDRKGFEITFIPSYVQLPNENENILMIKNEIANMYESCDPIFVKKCFHAIDLEALLMLPLEINEDEIYSYVYAIVTFVANEVTNKKEILDILEQKKLAQTGSFELLLNTLEYNNKY